MIVEVIRLDVQTSDEEGTFTGYEPRLYALRADRIIGATPYGTAGTAETWLEVEGMGHGTRLD